MMAFDKFLKGDGISFLKAVDKLGNYVQERSSHLMVINLCYVHAFSWSDAN
jgi:hypothetical protein